MNNLMNFLNGCPLLDEEEPPESENLLNKKEFNSLNILGNGSEDLKYYFHYDPFRKPFEYCF